MAELLHSNTAVREKIANTPTESIIISLTKLADKVLDPLREWYGKPIKVNCAYRCQKVNKLVGGATTSQHLKGEAADITAGSAAENKKLMDHIIKALPYDQAIYEFDGQWIHVSYSERNRRNALKSYHGVNGTLYTGYKI